METIVGARELVIRGYWDRYPSSDQRKHHRKYDAIAKDQRRGPTAYDLLMRDYNRFTPAQRRNLTVRVVYGVAPDTGKVLSARKITTAGMSLDIPSTRSEALDTLRVLLVRAGVVDSPKEWRVNKNAVRIEQHVPLGIQWVVVERETVASEWVTQHPRGAKGRFVKRGK